MLFTYGVLVTPHGQSAAWPVPQLGSCASSGRAWRLWAARHSQGEAGPLGAQPLPGVLDPAASKGSDSTAFHPSTLALTLTLTLTLMQVTMPWRLANAHHLCCSPCSSQAGCLASPSP